MLLKRQIGPSRPCVPRLPRSCGRRFLRSSPANFSENSTREWTRLLVEENKRRLKEARWTREGRDEVINAPRRPLEPLNHESRVDTPKQPAEGVDKLPLHEMTLDQLVEVSALVQKRIERLSRPSSCKSTRKEVKRFTEERLEGRDDELRALQEMRKENMERSPERRRSWTFRNDDFSRLEKDHFKAAEKRVEEMLARAKLPSPATRPMFESGSTPRQGSGHNELASRLSGTRTHSQQEVPNATDPESVPPHALKTGDQHSQPLASSPATFKSGSTESELSSPEKSVQERLLAIYRGELLPEDIELESQHSKLAREGTEKATEWLKDMLRKAGKLDEAPPGSQQWPIQQEFEPPQKIEPLVFSRTEQAWVKSENATSLDSNKRKFKFGDVLPVVQWNLRMFGPSHYIPARSTAAMDVLEEIFGQEPSSMALTLHEVNPQTLQSIMNHPWVQRNFLVGFDDKSNIFNGKFPAEVGLDDLPSVLLVSVELVTDNWISRRMGDSHRCLSADLPILGQEEQQDRRDVLRLCAARLERVVLGNRWTAFDEEQENNRKTKMEKEIDDFLKTGHNPEDNVISTVMARDLTFRHLGGNRSRQYRHKYKWWNNGAMRTREARVVDFWSEPTSRGFISNMEIDKLTVGGGQFQYGINSRKNLGHISQAGPTMDMSPPLLLSQYGLQFKVRSWREVVDNDMLGWPRNVARVQRSKYWPYGPGSRLPAFHQRAQSLLDLPRPPLLPDTPTNDVSQEATDRVEKKVPITNTEPTDDASASTPPPISYQEATEIMEKGLPIPRTEPKVSKEPKADASATTPPAFNVFTCSPGFNYDLTEHNEVMMWASDDYGVARNIKIIERVPGWYGGKRRKPKGLPPQEDTTAEVKTDSAGSTTEDPDVGRGADVKTDSAVSTTEDPEVGRDLTATGIV